MSVPTGSPWCNDQELRRLLGRQHGLITTDQAQAIGMSTSMFAKRAKRGDFDRVLPRVWRSTLVPSTVQQHVLAAVLWAGPDALASHLSAGRLWGVQKLLDELHVWVPGGKWRSELVVVHRGVLTQRDRRRRDGIPVTSPARTLADLAGLVDSEALEVAVEDFLHRGLTTPFSIGRCLDALRGQHRKGIGALRDLMRSRDGKALESPLEVKVWRLLRKAGLRPVRQYEVRCGDRTYRLDFAWPALKVAVEAEGYDAHGGAKSFVADRRRLADLAAIAWVVIPVTWDDCSRHPAAVVDRVQSALLRAA